MKSLLLAVAIAVVAVGCAPNKAGTQDFDKYLDQLMAEPYTADKE